MVAFNAGGSTASTTQTVAIPTAATWPVTPTGFAPISEQANATGVDIKLGWTANAANATGYLLSRTGGIGTFTPVSIAGRTTVTYTDTTAVIGTTYVYSLSAVNGAAVSAPATVSVTANTPPAAPSNLQAPSKTTVSVTLTWTNNAVPAASGVNIDMSTNGTTWTRVTAVSGTTTTYTVTGLTTQKLYYFRVFAYKSGAVITYSLYSPVRTVTTN